jgi:serine/threonine protein kinase
MFAQTITGTPYYQSPELLDEEPRYNHKSDIWSLGCLLYEIVALKRPFIAKNIMELSTKVMAVDYPPLPADSPRDLHTLVDMMLRRNPDDRAEISTMLSLPELASTVQAVKAKFRL